MDGRACDPCEHVSTAKVVAVSQLTDSNYDTTRIEGLPAMTMELTFVNQYGDSAPKRRRLAKACESCRARKV